MRHRDAPARGARECRDQQSAVRLHRAPAGRLDVGVGANFPERTGELELGPRQQYECLGDSQMVRWRDHGRAFQAHLYLGPRAGDQLKRDAVSILNSIQAR
jgi:hypothetical protein